MIDVQRAQILADHRHHRRDGARAHFRQPIGLRQIVQDRTEFPRERFADRDEIIAGIKAFGDRLDPFAESFAITQKHGAREHVDLGAGVVDVIFSDHIMARERQQAGQRIAEHGAPAMPDMHRPGRVGRNVFDIDLLGPARRATAVGISLTQHRA